MPHSGAFCIAKSCYNYHPAAETPAFLNLPSDLQSRNAWVGKCGRSDLKNKTLPTIYGKYYICADHFESHCFVDPIKRTMLRRDPEVVPTLFKTNLTSLSGVDCDEGFRDSQSTLAGTAQEILSVVSDDVLDTSEWTNIVAVSLGDDGNLMCDSLNSPSQALQENSVDLVADGTVESNATVLECLMLCRLCAALVQISMLVPVFGDHADGNLRVMIERIIPGQVLVDDGLPQRVCTSCVERVHSCCEILDLFKAADSRLRQMVELCNLNDASIVEDGSLALNEDNELPIILQTVDATPTDGLVNVTSACARDLSKEETSLHDCLNNTIELDTGEMKQVDPVSNMSSAACVTLASSINFSVHVPQDVINQNTEEIKPFKCSACQQRFTQLTDLLTHCINYHSIKIEDSVFLSDDITGAFQCTICNDIFSDVNSLRNHMFSHILGTYNCSLCKMVFKDKNQLNLHVREEHSSCLEQKGSLEDSSRNKCELCGKEFRNVVALRKHKLTHTGERTVLCSLCGKTLANLNSLRVHMRIHSEERPFTCAECGKSFKGSSELRSHSLTHSREKIYNCQECGRKFHSKGLVRQHLLSHTRDRPHKCDICTASFNRLGNLNQHKKKHTDKSALPTLTPYECDTCGKRFKSKLTLKYHLSKHTGEKYPFDCEMCGKKFLAIDPYRVHMRVHTGERPFECQVCKKTFRSSGTLKQHVASLHRDDFPYACPFCQRSFKRLQSLIVHKKTHTGEKPWRCTQCGRAFSQKGDMIKHTKTHRPHIEEEAIIMEVDSIDDLALDNEISKMIFG